MNSKLTNYLALLLVLIAQLGFAQGRTVTGTVTDNNGLPLPGVSILVKGTSEGTQTNFDGQFSIMATPAQVLVFSYVGMKQQEVVASAATLTVKMADDAVELEGVVVTALGIKRRDRSLGYATAVVSSDDITRVANQNFVNSLGGKVAGLQVIASGGAPGQASRLVIRGGNKSLTNNNEPLYVIDGVPMSNDNDGNSNTVTGFATPNRAADINPNDIENVTILKGAAGAVLYGNRGSNGVILITTKSGKNNTGVPVIEFTSQVAFDDALVLPEYQNQFAQGTNGVAYAEGTSRSFGPRITGQTVNSSGAGGALGLGPQEIQLKAFDPRKDFLTTGVTQNNNISLSNSNDKYSMFVSLGNSRQTSIIPNQGFEKINARFNGNYKFSDKFSAGINFAYNNSNGDVPFTGQDGSNPIFALFHVPVTWDLSGYGYERPNGTQINFRGGSFDNPFWTVNKNSAISDSKRYIMSANLAYEVADWMKISYRLGSDNLVDNRKLFKDIRSGSAPLGFLSFNDVLRNEITSTLTATFNKKITEKFEATLLVGQDINTRITRQSIITGTQLVLPGIQNTNNIQNFEPGFNSDSKRNLIGAFGNLTLSYNNYLFLDIVGRNEWSSTLPQENRSFFYPGASASFIFSEALNIQSDALTYGKLRVGASKTARDAGVYLTQQTFQLAEFADGFTDGITFPFNGLPGYTVDNTIANANLRPEFTTEYEVGVELKMLKNRLGFDASYFRNINTGGIIPLDISPTSGAQNTIINSGETRSNGVELFLRGTPFQTKDFRWDVSVNFTKIKSEVIETYPGVDKIFLGGFSGNPAIFAVKGERLGSIIGSGYQRNESGQILTDDDGFALFEDGKNLGYTEPNWTGGITNTFTYKNIYITAQIDTRQGGSIYSGTEELLDFYGVSAKTAHREEDYILPGVNANTGLPNDVVLKRDGVWYGSGLPNEEYVYKNNWVKLREVSIGYTFNLKDNRYIKGLDVSVYGRNLALWTKVPHIDPESSSFGTGNAQGVSRFAFPTTRTFGFNLRAQF
jgi:TonB-linked SusC/RagA family outer membrane protein